MTLFSELAVSSPTAVPSADLVAFGPLQFIQIRGRQPYSIVRKIPYLIEHLLLIGPRLSSASEIGEHIFPAGHYCFEKSMQVEV